MTNMHKQPGMHRRRFLAIGGAAAISSVAGLRLAQAAGQADIDAALVKLIGDKKPAEGSMIRLDLPEIAENGNTVPLKFEIDSPMTADNYVKNVYVFADGNPNPDVASFHFTPASGKAAASTRMRLAKTQNIVAVAEMSDGSVYKASKEVKVTIGGCGG